MKTKTALIFGISGQDGAYLAHMRLAKGYRVHGTSRDAEAMRFGNLVRLGIRDRVQLHSASLADFRSTLSILTTVAPDEIYNLAGQSSVALSFNQPVETLRERHGRDPEHPGMHPLRRAAPAHVQCNFQRVFR